MPRRFYLDVPVNSDRVEAVRMFFEDWDIEQYGKLPYWVPLRPFMHLWEHYADPEFVPFRETGSDGFIQQKFEINMEKMLRGEAIHLPKVNFYDQEPLYRSMMSYRIRQFFRSLLPPETCLRFLDGRHRTLALHRLGAENMPIYLDKPSVERLARTINGIRSVEFS